MKVIDTKEQKLFNRIEMNVVIDYKLSRIPSRSEIKEMIAKENNTDPFFITIEKIRSRYGDNEIRVEAYIYKDTLKKFQKIKKKEQPKVENK